MPHKGILAAADGSTAGIDIHKVFVANSRVRATATPRPEISMPNAWPHGTVANSLRLHRFQ